MTQSSDIYKFNYSWETVVKGFWNKYPNKLIDSVKFNKVIDIKFMDDDTLIVKRLVHSTKLFSNVYTIEEIKLDINQKVLDMKTTMLKTSNKVIDLFKETIEYCKYYSDENGNTLYTKHLEGQKQIMKIYLDLVKSEFVKGCKIVEQKCEEILLKEQDKAQ